MGYFILNASIYAPDLGFQGKNLNLVLSNDEIQVRIGEHLCNVTSISSTQLNCAMPDAALLSSDTTNPVVIVSDFCRFARQQPVVFASDLSLDRK